MSRKSLPVVGLVLTLIVVLATAGVAYGLWSQTLVIDGTVYTGTVDAEIFAKEVDQLAYDLSGSFNAICPSGGYSIDKDCDGDGSLFDDIEVENKDIGECTAVQVDAHTLKVTVTSGYPQYNCFVKYGVVNTGSIPIHIYHPDYLGVPADLHVNGWPPFCFADKTQLEPKEEAFCNLHINVPQYAQQGTTYTFQVKIFARQWNEDVPPPWR